MNQTRHFYCFGPFRLDATECLLNLDGKPVPLAPKAFEALLMLVENAGHLVDKDELMRRLWPGTFVEEANVAKHVSMLRKILSEATNGPEYIETIPKRGYRFVVEVRERTAVSDMKEQTHCLRGHPRTPENLRSNGRSWYCLLCANIDDKNARNRRRRLDPFGFTLSELRRNAKKRGQFFELVKEDFGTLPSHCPVLGIELDYAVSGGPNAACIDRSDSNRGYVPGNVVIMSKRAKILKNNATVEELQRVLDYIQALKEVKMRQKAEEEEEKNK